MNQEFELKLQAYLDRELSPADAAEVERQLAHDADGQALLEELRNTSTAMAVGEPEIKLPESREFYWSKIAREIERLEKVEREPARKVSWFAWARGHLKPLAGVAILLCLGMVTMLHSHKPGSQFGMMEMASDDMGAYTFRDQQQKMTMVWFYDPNADSGVADTSTFASMDEE